MVFTTLTAALRLDSSGFSAGVSDARDDLDQLSQRAASAGKRMQRAGAVMTAGITAPLAAMATQSIRTGSDIEEMQSKMSIVFEDLEDDVVDWSETHADAVNRSAFQLQEYATALQDTFVPMGFARDEAAEMSKEMSELAVDLASFNNMAEDEALSKLESGLMGNHRALRDFGVAINQSTLEQELLNEGMAESVQAASEQEKMMARMNIIMRNTEDAQGDAARTSESFANQMRGLRADTEELQAEIGEHLVPTATALIGRVSTLVGWFSTLSDRQQKAIIVTGGLAAAIGPLLLGVGTLLTMLPAMATGYGMATAAAWGFAGSLTGGVIPAALATQVALGPVTVPLYAIIAALGALVGVAAGAYYAWTENVFGIRDSATEAFETVKGWLDAAPTWLFALMGPVGWLYAVWRENFLGIRDTTDEVVGAVGDLIDWLIDKVEAIPGVDFSEDDVNVDEAGVEAEGEAAGEAYAAGFESGGQPDTGAMLPTGAGADAGEAIKGEMTPAMREALEDGVEGYVSDPDEIEDTATEIDENLFDAIAESEGGATAARLGVTEGEFQQLLQRFGDGGGRSGTAGSTEPDPATQFPMGQSRQADSATASSDGSSAEDIAQAVRDALEDFSLAVEVEGEENIIEIVDARFSKERKRSKFRKNANP